MSQSRRRAHGHCKKSAPSLWRAHGRKSQKIVGGPTGGQLGVREGPRAARKFRPKCEEGPRAAAWKPPKCAEGPRAASLGYGRAHGRTFGAKVGGGPTGIAKKSAPSLEGPRALASKIRPSLRRAHGRKSWKSAEGPRAARLGVRQGPRADIWTKVGGGGPTDIAKKYAQV